MVAIEEVLNELGWKDGFRIPIANEENKRLEEEIERKTKCKATLNFKLETLKERVLAIKKHATNLALQHDHNQKLLTAHSMQFDAEDHLYRMSNSTNSKIRQETHFFEKEGKDVAERISNRENELSKLVDKLEESKRAAKVDNDRLLRWEEALNRKEEDGEIIEKYAKMDRKKFKELELKRQKLSLELDTYRRTVVQMANEVYEVEIVLDRTAKLYVQALKERRRLINRWAQSVIVLRQRDSDIHGALREIETLQEVGKGKLEILQETEQFLNDQVINNKQLEESIKQLDRKLTVAKEEHGRFAEAISTYTFEVQAQNKILEDLNRRTQQTRAKIKQKKIDIENKRKKMEDWSKQINDLNATLKDIDGQRLNVADRTKQLEEMIENEEKHKTLAVREMNRLQELILRATSRLAELESERKMLELHIQIEQKKVESVVVFHAKRKKQLKDKHETIYHMDFDIQKYEMKLRRITGQECDKEETDKRHEAIENLQKVFNEKTDMSKLLQTQIANLEHDIRKISKGLTNGDIELHRLRNKKQDLMLLIDGGDKQLNVMRNYNEEKQVDENILRLKVFEAEQIMSNIGNKVYNLEKYRTEVQAAMQERRAEIKIQKEALNIRKRFASTDCSELRGAIAERKCRTQQLQTRYDNSVAAIGNAIDGSPMTVTYLKIQSAQEKYSLQEQGDKLDETIRRAEHEIRSMESTLRIVNACNEKYKISLGTIEDNGSELAERKKLDEETFNVHEKMRQKRAQVDEADADLKMTEGNYAQLLDDLEEAEEIKINEQRNLESLKYQIAKQEEKTLRADKCLRKVIKDIENSCVYVEDDLVRLQQKDLTTRELQEQNGLALQRIAEFTIRNVEVEAYVKKLLAFKSMALPCANCLRPQLTSSRCESNASSMSIGMSLKSGSRKSVRISSRESIGCITSVTPCFDVTNADGSSSERVSFEQPLTMSASRNRGSAMAIGKRIAARKK